MMSFRSVFLAAAFALSVAAPIGVAEAEDWPAFKSGPERTAFNADETVLGVVSIGAITEKWRVEPQGQLFQGPVVADGAVFVVTAQDIVAYNESDGRKIWRRKFNRAGGTAAAVAKGVVYLSFEGAAVMALDAKNGKTKWTAKTAKIPDFENHSTPIVVGKLVYVGGADGKLYALKIKNGKPAFAVKGGKPMVASPAVSNGVVYLATGAKRLVAYNAKSGKKLWTYATKFALEQTPAVSDGKVFVADAGRLSAVDAGTGKEIWARTFEARVSSPAVADGKVVVTADAAVALDAATGTPLWESFTGASGAGPAIANGVVYTMNNFGRMAAFNLATGAEIKFLTTGSGGLSTPVVANGSLYLATFSAIIAYR